MQRNGVDYMMMPIDMDKLNEVLVEAEVAGYITIDVDEDGEDIINVTGLGAAFANKMGSTSLWDNLVNREGMSK